MKKTILILLVLCLIPSYLLLFTIPSLATALDAKTTANKETTGKLVAKITTINKATSTVITKAVVAKKTSAATAKKTTTVKKAVVTKTTAVKKATVKAIAKPVIKTPVKTAAKPVAKVTWSASGLKSVARIPGGVRPAYKAKVENYARRNGIKIITAEVVAGMRE